MLSNKQKLIAIVKEEMKAAVSKIEMDHISENLTSLKSQIKILEAIDAAAFYNKADLVDKKLVSQEEDNPIKEMNKSEWDTINKLVRDSTSQSITGNTEDRILPFESANKKFVRGKFSQKLKGGVINNSIPVPESIIRKLDLRDGDWLEVKAISDHPPYRYKYEIISKSEEKRKVRNIARKETVFKDPGLNSLLIVVRDKSFDLPMKIKIKALDISSFDLKEGDLVDYAYFGNDVIDGRIIWKYHTENSSAFTIKRRTN